MTRPLGFTHLLPGEQSVSNEHATAGTPESTTISVASFQFVLIFIMPHSSAIVNLFGEPISNIPSSRSKFCNAPTHSYHVPLARNIKRVSLLRGSRIAEEIEGAATVQTRAAVRPPRDVLFDKPGAWSSGTARAKTPYAQKANIGVEL